MNAAIKLIKIWFYSYIRETGVLKVKQSLLDVYENTWTNSKFCENASLKNYKTYNKNISYCK